MMPKCQIFHGLKQFGCGVQERGCLRRLVLGLLTVCTLARPASAEERKAASGSAASAAQSANFIAALMSRELWLSQSAHQVGVVYYDGQSVASTLGHALPGQFIYSRPGILVANGQEGMDCDGARKGVVWVVPGTTYEGSYVVDRLGCDELMTTRAGGLLLARGPRNTVDATPNLTISESFDATTTNGLVFSPGGPGGVVSALQVESFVPSPKQTDRSGRPQWTRPFVWGLTSFLFDGGRSAPDGKGGAQHVALTGQLERTKRSDGDQRQGDTGFGLYGHVGSPNDLPSSIDGTLAGAEIDVAAHNLDQMGARVEVAVNCANDGVGSGAQCGHGILFGDADDGPGKPAAFNTTMIDAIGAEYLSVGVDLVGMQPVRTVVRTQGAQPQPRTLQLVAPLSKIAPGEHVVGLGIEAGTIVTQVTPTSGRVVLSLNATTIPDENVTFYSDGPALRVGDGRGIQMDTAGVFRVVYDPAKKWTSITVRGVPRFAVDADGRVHMHASPILDLP